MTGEVDPKIEVYVASVEAALAELRRYLDQVSQVVERPIPLPAAVAEPERRAGLVGKEWIEIGRAASRFNRSKATIWSWCDREPGFGWKRGGRWFVSISKMQARVGPE